MRNGEAETGKITGKHSDLSICVYILLLSIIQIFKFYFINIHAFVIFSISYKLNI